MHRLVNMDLDQTLRPAKGWILARPLPQNLALTSQGEDIAAVEIEEQQTAAWIDQEVAQRVEEEIAAVIGEEQGIIVPDLHEPRTTAAVRDISAVAWVRRTCVGAGDEKGIGARDEGGSVESGATLDPTRLAVAVRRRHHAPLAGVDVLRTVTEALRHPQRETSPVRVEHYCAIDPIAAARMELDPETTHHHAVAQCVSERIAAQGPRYDMEQAWLRGVEEARRADERRRPGAALLVHRRHEEKRQLCEKLAVLVRQIITDEASAALFDALA